MRAVAVLTLLLPLFSIAAQEITFQERKLASLTPAEMQMHSITFSRDGTKVAAVWCKDSPKWFVTINGKQVGTEFDFTADFSFAPTGAAYKFVGVKAGKKCFVFNGTAEEFHDDIDEFKFAFSQDGKHYVYVARDGGNWRVFIDGKASREYDEVKSIVLKPDGKQIAYAVRKGETWFIVNGGSEISGKWDFADVHGFSPDGKQLAYSFATNQKCTLVAGEKKFEGIDSVEWFTYGPIQVSSDFAFFCWRNTEEYVVTGTSEVKLKKHGTGLQYSPDGRKLIYRLSEGTRMSIMFGENESEEFDVIEDKYAVSPDSKSIAFSAYSNKTHYMIAGNKKIGPYQGTKLPTFNSDGKKFAFVAELPLMKEMIVCGGKKSEIFDGIYALAFNKDGSKLAFGALKNNELWWKVMDLK